LKIGEIYKEQTKKNEERACLPRIESKTQKRVGLGNQKPIAKESKNDTINWQRIDICLTSLLGPSLAVVVKDTRLGLTILSTSEMSATLSNATQRLLRPQSVSEVHRSTYLALNTYLHVKFA